MINSPLCKDSCACRRIPIGNSGSHSEMRQTFFISFFQYYYITFAVYRSTSHDMEMLSALLNRCDGNAETWIKVTVAIVRVANQGTLHICCWLSHIVYPDSKVHGANMAPIWGRQGPGGPHVGPMNFAIWVCIQSGSQYDSTIIPQSLNVRFNVHPCSKVIFFL